MLEITCLASSSAGNSYVISNGKDNLMIEAGLRMDVLRDRLFKNNLLLSDIAGCVISHSHGDHARSAAELSNQMPIIATHETLTQSQVKRNAWVLREDKYTKIGTYQISWFNLDHDCQGTAGFIIENLIGRETLLFINDTRLVRKDLSEYHFDYIMIECNHIQDLLDRDDPLTKRNAQSHMSLKAVLTTLSRMNLSNTREIFLMHLSDTNSNESIMRDEVMKQTGIPTYVCQKNGGVK